MLLRSLSLRESRFLTRSLRSSRSTTLGLDGSCAFIANSILESSTASSRSTSTVFKIFALTLGTLFATSSHFCRAWERLTLMGAASACGSVDSASSMARSSLGSTSATSTLAKPPPSVASHSSSSPSLSRISTIFLASSSTCFLRASSTACFLRASATLAAFSSSSLSQSSSSSSSLATVSSPAWNWSLMKETMSFGGGSGSLGTTLLSLRPLAMSASSC